MKEGATRHRASRRLAGVGGLLTLVALVACGPRVPSKSGVLTTDSMLVRHRLLVTSVESCVISTSGKVACWNHYDTSAMFPRSVIVPLPAPAVSLHDIGKERCAVLETTRVYCWTQPTDPQLRTEKKGAKRMFVAGPDVCWVDAAGRLVCDTDDPSGIPLRTIAMSGVVDGVGTPDGGCLVTEKGEVRCWFSQGQSGRGHGVTHTDAWPIPLPGRARWIGAGYEGMCAWVEPGDVYCWNLSMEEPPHPVLDPSEVATVAMGCRAGCSVDRSGGVRCWSPLAMAPVPARMIPATAPSASASVASGSKTKAPKPTRAPIRGEATPEMLPEARGAVEIALGCHLCALMPDDTVYCTGGASDGPMGQPNATHVRPYRFSPFRILAPQD